MSEFLGGKTGKNLSNLDTFQRVREICRVIVYGVTRSTEGQNSFWQLNRHGKGGNEVESRLREGVARDLALFQLAVG
jgi:hypothetical protein